MPAFNEILVHFSNSESELEVLIKEGTTTFVQDSKIFLVNMKSIVVSTYNESASPAGLATIYSIDQSQEKISLKAAFHLSKGVDVDLSPILTAASLSAAELLKIQISGAAFEAIRTSITLDHIVARRIATTYSTGVFINLIYLQEKILTLSKKPNIQYCQIFITQ